jgi:predicted enzyme related to lactoylglutathione lyase
LELNTARVFVEDLAAAKRFYGEQLGLPLKADGMACGYCVFKAGTLDLVVEAVPADAPAEDRALVGRFTGLSFSVLDASDTFQNLSAKGVKFSGEPERQSWGGTLATFVDPSGNALQIVEHPAAI